MGFPTKNYHFGVFGGYLRKPPNIEIDFPLSFRANMNTITKILLGDPRKHRHRTRKCTNMEETVNQFCKPSLNHVQFPAICKAVSPSSKTPEVFFAKPSSKTSESFFFLFQLLTSSQNFSKLKKKHISSPSWTLNNTTAVFSSHVTLNEDPNNAATHRHAELFPCHVRCLVFFIPSFKMGETESYSKESSRASVSKTGFTVNESLTMKRIPLPPLICCFN